MQIPKAAVAGGILLVALLASIAASDAIQAVQSSGWRKVEDGSGKPHWLWPYFDSSQTYWEKVVRSNQDTQDAQDTGPTAGTIQISEKTIKHRIVWTSVSKITVPNSSGIVRDVREGKASSVQERPDFASHIIGAVMLNNRPGQYSPPGLRHDHGKETAYVTVVQKFSQIPGERPEFEVSTRIGHGKWDVTATAPDMQIAAITGAVPYRQTEHAVVFRKLDDFTYLTIGFGKIAAAPRDSLVASTLHHPAIQEALTIIWYGLLPIITWGGLLFLLVTGRIGESERTDRAVFLVALIAAIYLVNVLTQQLVRAESATFSGIHSWYISTFGSELVLIAALACILPIAVSDWEPRPAGGGEADSHWTTGIVAVLVIETLTLAALLGVLGIRSSSWSPVLASIGITAGLILIFLIASKILGVRLYYAISLGLFLAILATLSPINQLAGPTATVLQVGITLLVATVALYAVARIGYAYWTGQRLSDAVSWKYRWPLIAILAIAAIPEIRFTSGTPMNWGDLFGLPYAVAVLASLAALVAFGALIRETLLANGGGSASELRMRGIAFTAITFFNPAIATHGLPVVFATGILLVVYWALPSSSIGLALPGPVPPQRMRKLVRAALRVRTGDRSASRLGRSMRTKVESGEVTYQAAEEKVRDLEGRLQAIRTDAETGPSDLVEAAFGSYRFPSRWYQAKVGAVAGLILGLPWIVVAI